MNAVEQEIDELRELVDGQESWSHRRRLHALEGDKRAAEIVVQAMQALRHAQTTAVEANRVARRSRLALIPQWGSFIVAALALLALYLKTHGAG